MLYYTAYGIVHYGICDKIRDYINDMIFNIKYRKEVKANKNVCSYRFQIENPQLFKKYQ